MPPVQGVRVSSPARLLDVALYRVSRRQFHQRTGLSGPEADSHERLPDPAALSAPREKPLVCSEPEPFDELLLLRPSPDADLVLAITHLLRDSACRSHQLPAIRADNHDLVGQPPRGRC
jgi:hypothetical protein